MNKRWLFLIGLGLIVGSGCTSSVSQGDRIQCFDSPDGKAYYCDNDELCCGGGCVLESAENCGVCGTACGDGSTCQDGACICEQTGKFCSMTCVNNPVNGGCVDPQSNVTHCGGNSNNDCDPNLEVCGKACQSGEVCSNGVCASDCAGDLENCGGSCVDTENNVLHCGTCHSACPLPDGSNNISRTYCLNGGCTIECQKGYADADDNIANGCEKEVTFVCGNGIVELGEMCDGLRLNDQTCSSIVGPGSTGILACRPDCMGFDATGCSASTTCGNGKVDGSEMCDGADLNGQTCATAVGAGSTGALGCNSNCTDFDKTSCTAPTNCGNGILDAGEMCDGTNIGNATCESVVGLGSTGTLQCGSNCGEFDKSSCTAAAVCGNGLLEAGEECDGNNFNGQTCSTLAGAGSVGMLSCNQCKITTDHCSAPSTCGDNLANGNDVCDGTDLKGATCESVVGEGSTGTLSCRDNCTGYDISGCTAASKCGNGIVEPGEACDGSSLNDQTCASQVGFGSTGTLRCDSKCQGFVTTGCSASTTCGNNGIIDAGEVCDMTNLRGATCENTVGTGSVGTVLCGYDCKSLNLSGCSAPTLCGNGALDAGEVCEGTDLNSATCESVVGTGSTGTLKCGDGCKHYDVSGCSKPTSCGDGAISNNEVCDPGDGTNQQLAGRTCADVVGYGSKGALRCANNCMEFDTSFCTAEIKCGNGKLDAGEICDGTMLNGATCSSQIGYGSTGTLRCNDTCDGFDTNSCTEAKKCGNGVLDAGETCDGSLLSGRTCEQQVGYGSTGTPGCNSTCTAYTKGNCTPELTCGNGKINPGEQCDNMNLNGKSCADVLGEGSEGTLKCDSSCEFNTTLCSAPAGCGNGRLDAGEECDGKEFAQNTTSCKAYKPNTYSSGTLSCTSECKVDVSACTAYCGNGSLNTTVGGVYIGEACDGTRFPSASNTCEEVVGMGSTGTLQCSNDCKTIITNQCTAPAICGDGKVNQASEYCDGTAFAGGSDDCSAFSSDYVSGNKVKCLSNCQLDVSACVAKPRCGDGIVNGNEECDINSFLFDETTCKGWDSQYESGNVTCNNTTCTVEYTNCKLPQPKCGNGILDENEYCDNDKFFDNITCADWLGGNATGTLKCNSSCEIDDSACVVAAPVCGDGNLDAGEECDGSQFRESKTCKNIDPALYASGSATCTKDCKVDVSSCTTYCGNGSVNTSVGGVYIGEACDGTRFPSSSNTCAKVVGTGSTGTLKCSSDCKSIDTTGCSDPVTEYCGDGIANGLEYCDGNDFADDLNTCEIWGYAGGTLKCKSNCDIDFSACTTAVPAYCGDGILNGNDEYCDGKAFDEAWDTCEKANPIYSGGTLKCTSDCEVDESACILKNTTTCGNGKLDEDEWCDGDKFLDDMTCQDASTIYSGGTLKCTNDCELDLTACTLHKCGDGILDANNEWCDGTKFLDNMNCTDISTIYSGGTLKCTDTCEFDLSSCQKRCGDGKLDSDEWCDGTKFQADADTCADWITDTTGTLNCTATCEVDTTNCKAKPTAYCGDGVVNTDAEECDGTSYLLDVTTCADYSSSYVSGNLKCNTSTCKVDTSACKAPEVPVCGDGKFDADSEYCDAGEFMYGIKTCAEYSSSYNSGMLKCSSTCDIDTSGCSLVVENTCGNGKLDPNEWCDGTLFYDGITACTTWGELLDSEFVAGNITCTANCEISTAACVSPLEARCGDGKINTANEECDGNAFELNVTSCAEYSNAYASGTLKCSEDCKLDTSACKADSTSTCGNGILEGNEECDGEKFFLDITACKDYSAAYSHVTANLKCTDDCKVDESECRADFCPENEILCAGDNNNDVVMCIDGRYEIVYDCAANQYCDLRYDENGVVDDGKCTAVPVALDWCTFHWFESSNNTGYGRILMPEGLDDDDVIGYMACTNDLSKPVSDWVEIDATHNTSCSDCYANQEYMTESYFGQAGMNYCTFLFMFESATYACRPQQTGAAEPILIVDGVTKLTADLTRSFASSACVEDDIRCNGNVLEMCIDGVYGAFETCTGATPICDVASEGCISAGVSYDVTETMNTWETRNTYSGTNSTSHGDAGTISAVARVNDSAPLIEGKSAVLRGGSYSTSITISGLKNGIGILSFQYATWGASDSVTLTVTDGTKSETISVKATDTSAITKTITFNNKSATTVTIKPTTGSGRALIDNVRWTSAQ